MTLILGVLAVTFFAWAVLGWVQAFVFERSYNEVCTMLREAHDERKELEALIEDYRALSRMVSAAVEAREEEQCAS